MQLDAWMSGPRLHLTRGPAQVSLRLWGDWLPGVWRVKDTQVYHVRLFQTHLTPPTPPRLPGAPSTTYVPAPLLDASQPSEPEPREQEVAEAPLPDGAEPAAEQRSSCSRRRSRPLDTDRASLLWASLGLSYFGNREETPSQVSCLHQTLRDTAGAPFLGPLALPSRATCADPVVTGTTAGLLVVGWMPSN